MDNTSKKLEMTYVTAANTNLKLSLDDPVDSIVGEMVSTTMEEIVGLNVLQDNKGNQVTASKSAQMVTITTNRLF